MPVLDLVRQQACDVSATGLKLLAMQTHNTQYHDHCKYLELVAVSTFLGWDS